MNTPSIELMAEVFLINRVFDLAHKAQKALKKNNSISKYIY